MCLNKSTKQPLSFMLKMQIKWTLEIKEMSPNKVIKIRNIHKITLKIQVSIIQELYLYLKKKKKKIQF